MPQVPLALPALESQVLVAFAGDYEANERVPPLPLWSNLLRVVGDDGVLMRDVPRLARVSRRAVESMVRYGERAGIVSVDGGRSLRVTSGGRSAREQGSAAVRAVDEAWRVSLAVHVVPLRDALEQLVGALDLELPHYPMGYGAVDNSVTGGLAGAHGVDWRAVVREGPASTSASSRGLALSALLSQALVAFAMDYERDGRTTLATRAVLQAIPDDGLPVALLPQGADVSASRTAGLERAGLVTVAVVARKRVVHLTDHGKSLCDEYDERCAAIESAWRERFGAGVVRTLRSSLEAISAARGLDAPAYPVVSWMGGFREVHGG